MKNSPNYTRNEWRTRQTTLETSVFFRRFSKRCSYHVRKGAASKRGPTAHWYEAILWASKNIFYRVKTTLETSGGHRKTTLETSGGHRKTTLETSGEHWKATLETSGEHWKLHSKRVENSRYMVHRLLLCFMQRIPEDDRDHFGKKRIDTAGPLMAATFNQLFRKMCKGWKR